MLSEPSNSQSLSSSPTATTTLECATPSEKGSTQNSEDPFEVKLDPSEHPQNHSPFKKWLITFIVCTCTILSTCASSIATFTETPMMEEYGVSKIVTVLSISLFVEGLGFGQLFVGPISELYGRNIVYKWSYGSFLLLSLPVTFAPNIVVMLVFRFITAICCSAFMSVAGGSVTDMFADSNVATPMALYTISVFFGPVLGPFIGGFINQNLYWRWTYRILIIWIFAQFVGILLFVPETYVPVLLKWKAQRLRKETGDDRYWCPLDRRTRSLFSAMVFSCTTPFRLLMFERMVLLLDTWTALMLGILYLAFQAFPVIFKEGHHFSVQNTGLSFTGIGLGMIIAMCCQPLVNRHFARQSQIHNGKPPPEVRLHIGKFGAILTPISLYALAFTTYPHVHWSAPIICSIPFGTGMTFAFTCTFTYLATVYRPISASALASNSAMRATFAAVFPLFAGAMYDRLGTVGATALLAGFCTLLAPLPFVFERIGERIRKKSKFAVQFD